ncbi:MAG: hypothetical protein KDI49_08350 [Gammaproteobacteria bacterium]|nr:hypothetical protein [Gammaproteobacteria bacterium]MCP5443364.1 hypothetical protein [Chromatiaceae bacterium]
MVTDKLKNTFLQRFFPVLFDQPSISGDEGENKDNELVNTVPDDAMPDIEYLAGLRAESIRIRKMQTEEEDRLNPLETEITRLEKERIEVLTQARVESDEKYIKKAAQLLKEIERLKREKQDALGIANQLGDKRANLTKQITEAERIALLTLGTYLEGRMKDLVDHYQTMAPDLAECVLQIRAVQKVMQYYKAGNSNGFQGEILLPDIKAFDHKTRPHLIDVGSNDFSRASGERADELKAKLQAVGHRYGQKYR